MSFEEIANSLVPLSESPIVFSCPQLEKEVLKIFGKNKPLKKDYSDWLDRQFEFMKTRTIEELILSSHFEFIERINEEIALFSLRRERSPGNPRILFSAVAREGEPIYFFLLAFSEKNKADYSRSIPVAKERMEYIIGLLEGG